MTQPRIANTMPVFLLKFHNFFIKISSQLVTVMSAMDEFDIWNIKKKNIETQNTSRILHCHEREIWWCALGKNIGSEENGKHENFERPVVIFRIFNSATLWAIPLTTKDAKDARKDFTFTCNGITRTADLAQMKLISTKRLLRYVDTISYEDFQIMRLNLKDLI